MAMANGKLKKNPKRLQSLKKKSKELSILCNIDVMLICKDDETFHSWPEDKNSCLSLIDKYKKSSNSVSALGKRKRTSDTQMEGFLYFFKKAKETVDNLECDELLQLLSWIDQTKMEVDQRVQFLDHSGEIQQSQLASHSDHVTFLDSFNVVSGDVDSDSGRWWEIFESSGKNDDISVEEIESFNVIDCKKIEGLLAIDYQESDWDVSGNEYIVAFEEEIRQILQPSDQDHLLVIDDQEDSQTENLMNSGNNYIEVLEISDGSDDEDEDSNDYIEILEISDSSDDEDAENEVELIPSSQPWLLLDYFDQLPVLA